ncbi:MAG: universal stress protein [Nitrospirota bacterium]
MGPRRIMVPVSFGPSSYRAFRTAAEMAATTGARLIVVNVMRTPKQLFHSAGAINFDQLEEQEREERKSRLDDFVKKELEALKLSVAVEEVNMEDSKAVKAILKIARDYNIDLMVLGHHEESRLEHFFFGRNVHKLVDGAPCDVIVTRTNLYKMEEDTAA